MSYWSGTVSDVYTNGIIANCGQSNFAQGYGCMPVVTGGATITGTPHAGQYFQMWGDLSKLPNITATYINYASTPFPTTGATMPPGATATAVPVATAAPVPSPTPVAAATAVPSGSYWAGTVSGVTGYGIIANCGQSNFGGYGCLPVTTTGAAVTGSPVAGQYFQMWGNLSKLPNITATTIHYGSTPFPATAPTAAPAVVALATAAPTVAPTPAQTTSTYMGMANASDYATSFTPYASTSIWRTPISANPTIASYSASVVAVQFPNGQNNSPIRATEAGQYDYMHPRYFATASDPLVNVSCTLYCGATANGGVPAQIHIPAKARSAGGQDSHFDIVQPDGTEISMWGAAHATSDWTTGSTVSAANVANCGSFSSGAGWLANGPGPTAAGYCDDAGIVTAAELIAGQINHALFVTGGCAVGSQYPVEYGGSTGQCASGVGPPLGGREWYDVPCAVTQANGALHPWEKAILCALNQYGAYLGDNDGSGPAFTGLNVEVESEEPWYDFNGQNYTSPFAPLASQGWYSFSIANARGSASGIRWVGADPWQPSGVNFAAHVHWLAPCSAQGSC
jgi:hypothetical protein